MNTPWYRNPKEKLVQAYELLNGIVNDDRLEVVKELDIFREESYVRFIYESNVIEKEGLNWHETRRLFDLQSGQVLSLPEDSGFIGIEPCVWVPKGISDDVDNITPKIIFKHGDRRREAGIVLHHFQALTTVLEWVIKYKTARKKQVCWMCLQGLIPKITISAEKFASCKQKIFNGHIPKIKPRNYNVFSEKKILLLHKDLANGFIDPEDGVAGKFRDGPIWTDPDSHYPDPSLVPKCIAEFTRRANKCISGVGDPIRKAARISGEFVFVHPFADFNGRTSRLIMNAILRSYEFPFVIAIRADKKSRKRYFNALKLARRGDWSRLDCLIAIEFIDQINKLNNILEMAGIRPIKPMRLRPGQLKSLDKNLEY